jgi:hypothetical protein
MTEDHQDDKEESHDTENEDTKANAEIVKTINTLPDNHYAWGYCQILYIRYQYPIMH